MGTQFMREVLNEPVSLGGFTWAYGFLVERLCPPGTRLAAENLYVGTALVHGFDKHLPDTRNIPVQYAALLWRAMARGDLITINGIVRLHWKFRVRKKKRAVRRRRPRPVANC